MDEPPFLFSYNMTRHSTTRHTPFDVHRGRDATLSSLPASVEYKQAEPEEESEKESAVSQIETEEAAGDQGIDAYQERQQEERKRVIQSVGLHTNKRADKMLERSASAGESTMNEPGHDSQLRLATACACGWLRTTADRELPSTEARGGAKRSRPCWK